MGRAAHVPNFICGDADRWHSSQLVECQSINSWASKIAFCLPLTIHIVLSSRCQFGNFIRWNSPSCLR